MMPLACMMHAHHSISGCCAAARAVLRGSRSCLLSGISGKFESSQVKSISSRVFRFVRGQKSGNKERSTCTARTAVRPSEIVAHDFHARVEWQAVHPQPKGRVEHRDRAIVLSEVDGR